MDTIRLLNIIGITVSVVILLADTLPSMVLRTAVVTPIWQAGLIGDGAVLSFIVNGHF